MGTESRIISRLVQDEMKQAYLDYSMSVIVGRALPDVRDGLKPVHRRILYAMHDLSMVFNKPFKKSARIVGEVLGKYHPHGDTAVYDAMVRMVQTFSLRYPLINGQGNFGSVDGDAPAAMRYTEARLNKLSGEILEDLEKETVKFIPNFDASLTEPTVLPSKFPNLLINGSSGIAVGMATNLPPHNLKEVCAGIIQLIDHPEISIDELMKLVPGPDFPTGALISGRGGIKSAYKTGRGKILIRSKITVEEDKKKSRIIVNEIPYQVNKAELIEQIAALTRSKNITGISDLRDESGREGIRVVIELKSNASPEVILNQLYKHSRLQITYGIIMLALVDNQPKILNLKELMQHFLDHRVEIVKGRTKYGLKKAEERSHILSGLIIALDDIDNAIRVIKASNNVGEAVNTLIQTFKLTEIQSKAILDMRLQKLTSLEQDKLRQEQKDLLTKIEEYKSILGSEERVLSIIKEELRYLTVNYGDERRTQLIDGEENFLEEEDLIKKEEMVITITHNGYVKRLPVTTYREQKRGGRGIIAAGTGDNDFVEDLFIASTHDSLLFFTNKGKVHWLKVYQLPQASRQARGTAIVNLLQLDKDEKVSAFTKVEKFEEGKFIFMATRQGKVKKTSLTDFSRPRRGGIIALSLSDKDELINATLTDGGKEIIVATKKGQAVRFNEKDVREMGRTASGVRGIKLKADDGVIGMIAVDPKKKLLTITKKGYGKKTPIEDYRLISRGGSGVTNLKITEKNGDVVTIKEVDDTEELMLISKNGIIIRMPSKDISTIGRATQGVRLMKIASDDQVVAAAKVITEQ